MYYNLYNQMFPVISLHKSSLHARSIYREMLLSGADSHHDFERAVRDVLSAEPHVDDVGSWLWGGVEDVEGPIFVLDDLCFHFGPIGCDDDARDLPFACTFCVHHKSHLLSDADGGADARACEMRIRRLVCAGNGKNLMTITRVMV